jgi:hypothetical protein
MIQSREHALRCAASLPRYLLFRGWSKRRTTDQEDTLSNLGIYGRVSDEMAEQLTKCADAMAQRIITGRSR